MDDDQVVSSKGSVVICTDGQSKVISHPSVFHGERHGNDIIIIFGNRNKDGRKFTDYINYFSHCGGTLSFPITSHTTATEKEVCDPGTKERKTEDRGEKLRLFSTPCCEGLD